MNEVESELLTASSVVEFNVISSKVEACADGKEAHAQAILILLDEDDEKGYNTIEWGAFGFIYIFASLSFNHVSPRNTSKIDHQEVDHFKHEDMIRCLSFTKGALRFYCDYLRGRLVKTEIAAYQDGRVEVDTVCRGNAFQVWIRKLQAERSLKLV
ncbi:MAG: hypothetical protein ACI9Y1_003618 [Lentisphaeria bacterium]|jgi:hypothetical protein